MMRVDHAALAIVYRWTFDLEGDSHFLQVSLDSQALSQRCPSTFARHISEDWKRKFAETAKSLSQPR